MGTIFRFFLFSGTVVLVMACSAAATTTPLATPAAMSEVLEGFSDADMDGMVDYHYVLRREGTLLTYDEELGVCHRHAKKGFPAKEDTAFLSLDDVRYHRSIQTWEYGSLLDRQAVGTAAMLELGPSTRLKYCVGLLDLQE